jgi:hypothetical protein
MGRRTPIAARGSGWPGHRPVSPLREGGKIFFSLLGRGAPPWDAPGVSCYSKRKGCAYVVAYGVALGLDMAGLDVCPLALVGRVISLG